MTDKFCTFYFYSTNIYLLNQAFPEDQYYQTADLLRVINALVYPFSAHQFPPRSLLVPSSTFSLQPRQQTEPTSYCYVPILKEQQINLLSKLCREIKFKLLQTCSYLCFLVERTDLQ